MPYNTKHLPLSGDPLPTSSFFNANADRHDVVQGSSGAMRVRIADGDHVAIGSRADVASSGDLSAGSFSMVSLMKEFVSHARNF